MAQPSAWTRDQLLLTLRLYIHTPFGKLHSRNPEIIALANRLGRTPGSVAMKLSNFASLDPNLDRTGLSGTSRADRAIWEEFEANSEEFAAEVEEVAERVLPKSKNEPIPVIKIPSGETDVARVVRVRRVQSFFREAVLATYNRRCAISGIDLPELLVACHIIPWSDSVEHRANPKNGLCLNALFDRAFDRGLLSLDEKLRVIIAKRLINACRSLELKCSLLEAEGRQLELPKHFPPDPLALDYHRSKIFCQ